MDDERLKNPNGYPDYFDELLEHIRDIKASKKRFYQKLRDLFKLSSDYDTYQKATQMFFAETQNKLLYAVTHHTATELIASHANSSKPNMGLTSWKGTIVRLQDIMIAKNYLEKDEIDTLNRLVTIFLETAELRVKERKSLTLDYWRNNVNNLLNFQNMDILPGKGTISNNQMELFSKKVYEKFDQKRKESEAKEADLDELKALEDLEKRIKKRNNN